MEERSDQYRESRSVYHEYSAGVGSGKGVAVLENVAGGASSIRAVVHTTGDEVESTTTSGTTGSGGGGGGDGGGPTAVQSFIAPLLRPVTNDRRSNDDRYNAFEQRDVEASKLAHANMFGTVPLNKKTHLSRDAMASSDFLRAIVFGGLDGINSIFSTIAACQGAQLSATSTLTVGLCSLLANAIAMGFGEYLSATSEEEFVEKERQKEEWELINCPVEEKREMVEIYEHRWGFSKEDAQTVIEISSRYKDFFISHMMAEELGLLVPDASESAGATPAQKGVVMYLSFLVFGLIPLLAFWLLHTFIIVHFALPHWTSFVVCGAVSCLALFSLGILKSRFLAADRPALTGILMVLNGGGAGLIAFLIGFFVQRLFGNTSTVVD